MCKKMMGLMARLFCVLLCAQMIGCTQRSIPPAPQSSSAISEEASAPKGSLPAPGEPQPEKLTQEALDEWFASIVHAVEPVAKTVNGELPGNTLPTRAQYLKLIDTAAALGVPVGSQTAACSTDLRNYQTVADACEAMKAGKDASTALYFVDIDSVSEYLFDKTGESLSLVTRVWVFGREAPEDPTIEKLDDLKLWDNGWMVWHPKDEPGMENSYRGTRVLPLGEENYQLLEKYVAYICSNAAGVTSRNWDAQDMTRINWDFTFEGLLAREGKYLWNYRGEGFVEPDGNPFPVPADDVEGLLTRHFPVTVEQLRTLPAYDAAARTYRFLGFQGGGYFPVIEVTKKTNNPDGSFTLRVVYTSPEFNTEKSGSFDLTILSDADGGFRYLSNKAESEQANDPAWGAERGLVSGVLPG